MLSHFEDLLCSTANEGASAPTGISNAPSQAEVDLLMEAWFRERQDCIEYNLCLDRAERLLRRILADGIITNASRREAKHLLMAIGELGPGCRRDDV